MNKKIILITSVLLSLTFITGCEGSLPDRTIIKAENINNKDSIDYWILEGKQNYINIKNNDNKLNKTFREYVKDINKYINSDELNKSDLQDMLMKGSFIENFGYDRMDFCRGTYLLRKEYDKSKIIYSIGNYSIKIAEYNYKRGNKYDESLEENKNKLMENINKFYNY